MTPSVLPNTCMPRAAARSPRGYRGPCRCQIAAGRHHQRDGLLGDGGVAIALDGVNLDAERFDLRHVHVARGAGAEEHDVLEALALPHQIGRHVGMIVDGDFVVTDDARNSLFSNGVLLMMIAGSSGRMTRFQTAPSCGLQSIKMLFIVSTRFLHRRRTSQSRLTS